MTKQEYGKENVRFRQEKKALSKYYDIYNAMIEDYIPEDILLNHIEQLVSDEQYQDIPVSLKLRLIKLAVQINTSTEDNIYPEL